MRQAAAVTNPPELPLRLAARIAAAALLVSVSLAPPAYFGIFPGIIVRGDAAQTVRNITGHQGLFLLGVFCYFATFVADLVIAWALGIFLRPSGAALSRLAAWFRLAYGTVALASLSKLVLMLRIARSPEFAPALDPAAVQAQVQLTWSAFRVEWAFSMLIFAIHLGLLGVLILRARQVPRVLGIVLLINGLGYAVDTLRPLLTPTIQMPYLFLLFFGEIFFMVWLFVYSWRRTVDAGPAPRSVAAEVAP